MRCSVALTTVALLNGYTVRIIKLINKQGNALRRDEVEIGKWGGDVLHTHNFHSNRNDDYIDHIIEVEEIGPHQNVIDTSMHASIVS